MYKEAERLILVCARVHLSLSLWRSGLVNQFSASKFPLTPELKAKGMTDETWGIVCKSLAKGKGYMGFGWGFSQVRLHAHASLASHFSPLGLLPRAVLASLPRSLLPQAINEANREYFKPIGCVACYAEYYKGQKAMVVLTEEVAKAGRAEFPVRTLAPSKYLMGMSGDSMAGMPDDAIGYVAEGAMALFGTQCTSRPHAYRKSKHSLARALPSKRPHAPLCQRSKAIADLCRAAWTLTRV